MQTVVPWMKKKANVQQNGRLRGLIASIKSLIMLLLKKFKAITLLLQHLQ